MYFNVNFASSSSSSLGQQADMEKMFNKLKKSQIRPRIARRVGLNNVADAHEFLEMDKARGLVVCLPWKRITKITKDEVVATGVDDENKEEKEERQDEVKPKREKQRSFSGGLFGGRDRSEKRLDGSKKEQATKNDD
jgi:hypothetical protein